MPTSNRLPEEARADIVARLKRIEGQAKGIQKMIADDRDCLEILDQTASIKAATNALTGQVLEAFALYCLHHPDEFASPEEAVAQTVRALVRAGR